MYSDLNVCVNVNVNDNINFNIVLISIRSRISQWRGCQPQPVILVNFPLKLHENEIKIGTRLGDVSGAPLNLPMLIVTKMQTQRVASHKFCVFFCVLHHGWLSAKLVANVDAKVNIDAKGPFRPRVSGIASVKNSNGSQGDSKCHR